MQYNRLGPSELKVSKLGLGTMTWGEQNSPQEAFDQIDYALDQGINWVDSAEMYPVPPSADTQGRSEEILGQWLKKSGKRDKIILSTKVAGRSNMDWFRGSGEATRLSPSQIRRAVEDSLKRLQTETIDLYQLHWPDRRTNFYGQRDYIPRDDDDAVALEDSLGELGRLIEQGKLRYIGLSNETPWGLMHCLYLAKTKQLPRVVSLQNPYSLLNRMFELGLAECVHKENVGFVGHSPLAFGVLTGKYLHGEQPEDSRLTRWRNFSRYSSERGMTAAAHYVKLAENNALSPVQMAIAYAARQPLISSVLIGATQLNQLKNNIASLDLELSEEVIEGIQKIHDLDNNPCP